MDLTAADLRRAADKLTAFYQAAPPRWEVGCAWDTGVTLRPETPTGERLAWSPISYAEPARAQYQAASSLAVTLRPIAPLIVDLIRQAADEIDANTGVFCPCVHLDLWHQVEPIARRILGES